MLHNDKRSQPFLSDAEPICQVIKHETVVLSTNGITNGEDIEEENGIGLATNHFKQYCTE